ncbi:hypothetical protein CALCODRAFT_513607 [Calocera cornea HHB12733]|uniref:Uncharacterized protein n=1 Tax=Calocera cornea HHB12733 TaxID=1353952 RepID=A0A166LBU5_9BASI|nr:hypothetical protein CALCODRAFT_513607 [Calocera cornea HHB12733]
MMQIMQRVMYFSRSRVDGFKLLTAPWKGSLGYTLLDIPTLSSINLLQYQMTKGRKRAVWKQPVRESHLMTRTIEVDIASVNANRVLGDSKSPLKCDTSGDIEDIRVHDFVAPHSNLVHPNEHPEYVTDTHLRLKDTQGSGTEPNLVHPSEHPEYVSNTHLRLNDAPGSGTDPNVIHSSEHQTYLTNDSDTESLLSGSSSDTEDHQEYPTAGDSDENRFRLVLADELRAGFRVVTNRGSPADFERMKHMDPRLNLLIHGFKDHRDKTGVVPEGQRVDLWAAWVHARDFAQNELRKRRHLVIQALHVTYNDFLDALAPPAYDEAVLPPYPSEQAGTVQPHNEPNASLAVHNADPVNIVEPDAEPLFQPGQLGWSTTTQAFIDGLSNVFAAGRVGCIDTPPKLSWLDHAYRIFQGMTMYG